MSKVPERWQRSERAIRAVQVAFDVEDRVLQAVRRAAFDAGVSNSDQIRRVLGLPTTERPKRPRLTVSLSDDDYRELAQRYGLEEDQRLEIKEQVLQALMAFAQEESKP
ncbi:hypothetical protein ACTSKR_06995 [Chitinibacteraceae bacterium HSL-7]